jgi:hypothetical protein
MSNQRKDDSAKPNGNDKLQDLLPADREPIHQGQQFDEMQRQHKNPDNTQQKDSEPSR